MKCGSCNREIEEWMRTGVTFMGALCEICLDKADQCAPREEVYDAIDARYDT